MTTTQLNALLNSNFDRSRGFLRIDTNWINRSTWNHSVFPYYRQGSKHSNPAFYLHVSGEWRELLEKASLEEIVINITNAIRRLATRTSGYVFSLSDSGDAKSISNLLVEVYIIALEQVFNLERTKHEPFKISIFDDKIYFHDLRQRAE